MSADCTDLAASIRKVWKGAPHAQARSDILTTITLTLNELTGTKEDPDVNGHRGRLLNLILQLRLLLDEHTLRGGAPWSVGRGGVGPITALAVQIDTTLALWQAVLRANRVGHE